MKKLHILLLLLLLLIGMAAYSDNDNEEVKTEEENVKVEQESKTEEDKEDNNENEITKEDMETIDFEIIREDNGDLDELDLENDEQSINDIISHLVTGNLGPSFYENLSQLNKDRAAELSEKDTKNNISTEEFALIEYQYISDELNELIEDSGEIRSITINGVFDVSVTFDGDNEKEIKKVKNTLTFDDESQSELDISFYKENEYKLSGVN